MAAARPNESTQKTCCCSSSAKSGGSQVSKPLASTMGSKAHENAGLVVLGKVPNDTGVQQKTGCCSSKATPS